MKMGTILVWVKKILKKDASLRTMEDYDAPCENVYWLLQFPSQTKNDTEQIVLRYTKHRGLRLGGREIDWVRMKKKDAY